MVDLGVVGVKSYSRRRHNDKALSAPFLLFKINQNTGMIVKTTHRI